MSSKCSWSAKTPQTQSSTRLTVLDSNLMRSYHSSQRMQTRLIVSSKTRKRKSKKSTGSLTGEVGKKYYSLPVSFHVLNPRGLLDLDYLSLTSWNLLMSLKRSGYPCVWRKSSSGRGIHVLLSQKGYSALRRHSCEVWMLWEQRGYAVLFHNKGEDYSGEWGQDESILLDVLLSSMHSSRSSTHEDTRTSTLQEQGLEWPSASQLRAIERTFLVRTDTDDYSEN